MSEGALVSVRAADKGISALCTVPERDRLDQPPVWHGAIAQPSQPVAIRHQCTAVSGFDFTNARRLAPVTVTIQDAADNVIDSYSPEIEWLPASGW